ncbi:MAG: sensor histidine kinase [Candidatus Dormibacterales bacterium]
MTEARGGVDPHRLVSAVGHELRTPLTVLRGVATLLVQAPEQLEPARIQELLRLVDQQVEAMSDRIEDMLAISALDSGRLQVSMDVFQVDEVFSEVQDWAALLEEGARVAVRGAPGVAVEGDRERAVQALRALLQNAFRHVPGDSPIEVVAEPDDWSVRIEVLDRGPGLPTGLDPFEPFAGEGGGSGLGLYLVAGLARAMGGDAAAVTRPGGGSAVSFTLRRRG